MKDQERRKDRVRTVVGLYGEAFGRRRWPLVIVKRCPTCGRGPNIHRLVNSALADGSIKTGTCGHKYKIRTRAALGVVAA